MKKKPMKRNTKIIIIIIVAFLLAVFVYKNAFKSLGVIRKSTNETQTGNSQFTFTGKQGMEIKMYYSPDFNEGTVNIVLTDKDNNTVETISGGDSTLKHVTLSGDGEYTVTAQYTDFKGTFKIRVEK